MVLSLVFDDVIYELIVLKQALKIFEVVLCFWVVNLGCTDFFVSFWMLFSRR